ncbi:hypothetical protein AAMO2058_000096100 [Amorphochlora amoebiformis]
MLLQENQNKNAPVDLAMAGVGVWGVSLRSGQWSGLRGGSWNACTRGRGSAYELRVVKRERRSRIIRKIVLFLSFASVLCINRRLAVTHAHPTLRGISRGVSYGASESERDSQSENEFMCLSGEYSSEYIDDLDLDKLSLRQSDKIKSDTNKNIKHTANTPRVSSNPTDSHTSSRISDIESESKPYIRKNTHTPTQTEPSPRFQGEEVVEKDGKGHGGRNGRFERSEETSAEYEEGGLDSLSGEGSELGSSVDSLNDAGNGNDGGNGDNGESISGEGEDEYKPPPGRLPASVGQLIQYFNRSHNIPLDVFKDGGLMDPDGRIPMSRHLTQLKREISRLVDPELESTYRDSSIEEEFGPRPGEVASKTYACHYGCPLWGPRWNSSNWVCEMSYPCGGPGCRSGSGIGSPIGSLRNNHTFWFCDEHRYCICSMCNLDPPCPNHSPNPSPRVRNSLMNGCSCGKSASYELQAHKCSNASDGDGHSCTFLLNCIPLEVKIHILHNFFSKLDPTRKSEAYKILTTKPFDKIVGELRSTYGHDPFRVYCVLVTSPCEDLNTPVVWLEQCLCSLKQELVVLFEEHACADSNTACWL